MTKSLRWRLQLWHAVILTAAVTLFGAAFFRQFHRSTMGEIDAELISGARVLEGTLRALPPDRLEQQLSSASLSLPLSIERGPPRRPGREEPPLLDRGPPPRRFGPPAAPIYFAVFGDEGKLLREQTNGEQVVWVATRRPLEFRNVEGRREVLLRGPAGTLIVVGRDVQDSMGRLTEALIQLILIGALVLCLGLVGGWWLTGKAIRPIEQISSTAESITAKKLNERIDTASMDAELQSLGTTLNSMLMRLETSFEKQVQFTADASHELRTPISVLISHCELGLSRTRSAEDYRTTLGICLKAASRMKGLVDGLLALARADSGELVLQRSSLDLQTLAQDAVEMFKPYGDERDVTIEIGGTSALCQGDATRLTQVISNLLQNAIVYNEPGGTVTVHTHTDNGFACLVVRDDGPGIPEDSLPHIFDRFYRVDEARSRQLGNEASSGSGLGLSICKSIVDAHGGTLSASSPIDEAGSVFEIRLPYTVESPGDDGDRVSN